MRGEERKEFRTLFSPVMIASCMFLASVFILMDFSGQLLSLLSFLQCILGKWDLHIPD